MKGRGKGVMQKAFQLERLVSAKALWEEEAEGTLYAERRPVWYGQGEAGAGKHG
jgi:hypothetical protein